jgi:hypothetical protein
MPIPPIYDDGQLRLVEKQDQQGSRVVFTTRAVSGAVLYEQDIVELRDRLDEHLSRFGR